MSTKASWTIQQSVLMRSYQDLPGTRGQEPEILLSKLEQQFARSIDTLVEFVADETGGQVNTVRRALETKTVETPLALDLTKTDQKRGKGRKKNNVTGPAVNEHKLLIACGQDPKFGRNFQKAHLDTWAQLRILCCAFVPLISTPDGYSQYRQ